MNSLAFTDCTKVDLVGYKQTNKEVVEVGKRSRDVGVDLRDISGGDGSI